MTDTHEAPDPVAEARALARMMADDPAVRVDLAYELVIARSTVQALNDELDQERRRLDASVQALGRGTGPLRGFGTIGSFIRALALLIGGMIAFAILSLGLQTLAPRWGLGTCIPVEQSR